MTVPTSGTVQRRQGRVQIQSALFDPPPFDPAKLDIDYLPGTTPLDASVPHRRRYTLTHNDLTGTLRLSVGLDYNSDQLSGWYTRIVRDEVLAEWIIPHGGSMGSPVLNVFCHVSGEELWPAPPALRSFIFQREMKLVLDTIAYAERHLLAAHPVFDTAPVYVHLRSDLAALNKVLSWGSLGDRSTWRKAGAGRGLLAEVLSGMAGVLGDPSDPHPDPQQEALQQAPSGETTEGTAPSATIKQTLSTSTPVSRELERRTSTLAGRARGAVSAAMRRSPLTPSAAGVTPGRPGSKMVAVAAQRVDSMWPAGGSELPDGGIGGQMLPPVEASLRTNKAEASATSRNQ